MAPELLQTIEAQLVAAVLNKDRKATAEFVSRFGGPLHAYLSRRLMPRHDVVEDLFQQTFLEAWLQLARFRGDSGVQAWLLGIARHKVQDHYRSRLREFQFDEDAPEPTDTADFSSLFDRQVSQDRVWAVLASLEEEHRILLLWRYWENWNAQTMAAAAGKSVKGVERALARARDQFKRRWYIDERQSAQSRQAHFRQKDQP